MERDISTEIRKLNAPTLVTHGLDQNTMARWSVMREAKQALTNFAQPFRDALLTERL